MPLVKNVQALFSDGCDGETKVKIVGIPLEETVTFRRGTSQAPRRLRELFSYVEYTTVFGNVSPSMACDMGDIELVPGDIHGSVKAVIDTYSGIEPPTIAVGGEHTLTYATILATRPKTYIHIDAHMDLRNEYPPGASLTHATFLRRVLEQHNVYTIMMGVRSYDDEEEKYAKENDMYVLKWKEVNFQNIVDAVSTASNPTYLSIDVDVLNPSEAPGVGNPEWGGISYDELINIIIAAVLGADIKRADVAEYTPLHDVSDITGIQVLGILAHLVKLMGSGI